MENKESKSISGEVVSVSLDKTCVVLVGRVKTDRLYKKKYKVTKKYLAHDENNEYKVSDIVKIIPVRPISKNKCYKIIGKV